MGNMTVIIGHFYIIDSILFGWVMEELCYFQKLIIVNVIKLQTQRIFNFQRVICLVYNGEYGESNICFSPGASEDASKSREEISSEANNYLSQV